MFYTAELLNKPNLHSEIFREINLKGNRLDTPQSIEAFFTSRGISKADFQKAFASFAVDTKIMKAEDLNRRYKITSTPTVVVNGKYVTDVSMAGGEDKLFQVINALVAKEKPRADRRRRSTSAGLPRRLFLSPGSSQRAGPAIRGFCGLPRTVC